MNVTKRIIFDAASTSNVSGVYCIGQGECVQIRAWNLGAGETVTVEMVRLSERALGSIDNSCNPLPLGQASQILDTSAYAPCGYQQFVDDGRTAITINVAGCYRFTLSPAALGTAVVEATFAEGGACAQMASECCCQPEVEWNGSSSNACLTITPGGPLGHSPTFNLDACCLLQSFPANPNPSLTDELVFLSGGGCFRATIDEVFSQAVVCDSLYEFPQQNVVALADEIVVLQNGTDCVRVSIDDVFSQLVVCDSLNEFPAAGVVNPTDTLVLLQGGACFQAQVQDVVTAAFPLLAPDGSCAAPSYSFATDSASGLLYEAGVPAVTLGFNNCASYVQVGAIVHIEATNGDFIDVGASINLRGANGPVGSSITAFAGDDTISSGTGAHLLLGGGLGGNGGNFTIQGGNAGPAGGGTGARITTGLAGANGQNIQLIAGDATVGNGLGGPILGTAGAGVGAGSGGSIVFTAGGHSTGFAGGFVGQGGFASAGGFGGNASLVAGGSTGGGSAGHAVVQAGGGAAGALDGEIRLLTGTAITRLAITGLGEWLLPVSAGLANQVITSQGPGLPPIWATPAAAVVFPLLAPDGSCAAPSYSFTSSPDSGMFYDPAGVGSVVIGDDNCADFISVGASIVLQTQNGSRISLDDSGVDSPYQISLVASNNENIKHVRFFAGSNIGFGGDGGNMDLRAGDGLVGAASGGSINAVAGGTAAGSTGVIRFAVSGGTFGPVLTAPAGALGNGMNLVMGPEGGALLTTATNGFLYLSGMTGVPTGVPTAYAGNKVPLAIDTTGGTAYAYYSGAWNPIGGGGGVAEPATQIVYGTGPSVDSDNHFLYNVATGQFLVNETVGASILSVAAGNDVRINAATVTAGIGRSTFLRAGVSTADNGGQIFITGGNTTANTRFGGNTTMQAGDGAAAGGSAGGELFLRGGDANNGDARGGSVWIRAGNQAAGVDRNNNLATIYIGGWSNPGNPGLTIALRPSSSTALVSQNGTAASPTGQLLQLVSGDAQVGSGAAAGRIDITLGQSDGAGVRQPLRFAGKRGIGLPIGYVTGYGDFVLAGYGNGANGGEHTPIAAAATNAFVWLPRVAAAPTGTPSGIGVTGGTGYANPTLVQQSGSDTCLWVYNFAAGAWHSTCFDAGGAIAAPSFPLLAPDGSCAAPSYSFTSDSSSGMFYDAGAGSVIIGDANCTDFIEIGASINITSSLSTILLSAGNVGGNGGGSIGVNPGAGPSTTGSVGIAGGLRASDGNSGGQITTGGWIAGIAVSASIRGPDSPGAAAGDAELQGGSAGAGTGGDAVIIGGNGSAASGDVIIRAGTPSGFEHIRFLGVGNAWNIGGAPGVAGQAIVSAGPGAPPAWGTPTVSVALNEVADSTGNATRTHNNQITWNWGNPGIGVTAFSLGLASASTNAHLLDISVTEPANSGVHPINVTWTGGGQFALRTGSVSDAVLLQGALAQSVRISAGDGNGGNNGGGVIVEGGDVAGANTGGTATVRGGNAIGGGFVNVEGGNSAGTGTTGGLIFVVAGDSTNVTVNAATRGGHVNIAGGTATNAAAGTQNGNVYLNVFRDGGANIEALAAAATSGFIYLQRVSGPPTGTPVVLPGNGQIAMVVENTSPTLTLWMYDPTGAAWRSVALS